MVRVRTLQDLRIANSHRRQKVGERRERKAYERELTIKPASADSFCYIKGVTNLAPPVRRRSRHAAADFRDCNPGAAQEPVVYLDGCGHARPGTGCDHHDFQRHQWRAVAASSLQGSYPH